MPYLQAAVTTGAWTLRRPLYWLIWALPLLPCVPSTETSAFLLNPPAWSLFLEIVINLLYALALPRLNDRALAMLCVASTLGFAVIAAVRGTFDFGSGGWWLLAGLVRITAPFSLGILLFRRWPTGWRSRSSLWSLAPPLVFLASVATPTGASAWAVGDVCVIMLIFPSLIMLAASARPTGAVRWGLHWLGELSYPLYTLHLPVLIATQQLAGAFGHSPHRAVYVALPLAFAAAVASIFLYDRPVRAWLERALGVRRRDVDAAPPL